MSDPCGCDTCRQEHEVGNITFTPPTQTGTPFKCPVCSGKGFVSSDFYQIPNPFLMTTTWTSFGPNIISNSPPETCRSCGGKGIVWAA